MPVDSLTELRALLQPGRRLYWIRRVGLRGARDVFDVAILERQQLRIIGPQVARALQRPYWHHWAGFEVARAEGPEVFSQRLLVALWPALEPSPEPFRISIV
jgi:hypothetical protein